MASGTPDWSPRIISSARHVEDIKAGSTATDSTHSFSQQVKAILIYNDGPAAVYNNIDAAATTSKFKIPPKTWHTIDIEGTDVHLICDTGLTATCYIRGVY